MNCNIRIQLYKHLILSRLFRTLCAVLLLVVGSGGMNSVWAQSEGVYYIDNYTGHDQTTDKRYYLIPADDPQKADKRDAFYSSDYSSQNGDPTKPFLTTYRTNKDAAAVPAGVVNNLPNNSVWIWKAVSGESGFFNIIHAASGKYVVYEPPHSAATNRKSMHLLATNSPGENAKFEITVQGGGYKIRPKSVTSGNRYFNPAGTAWDAYHANGGNQTVTDYIGLVGLYSAGGASTWYTESTLLPAPTISYDPDTRLFTISYDKIPAGFDILYTTDGSNPTVGGAGVTTYSGPTGAASACTVKAVVARYGMVLTEVASQAVEPLGTPDDPVIATSDDCSTNNTITITSAGATIYYTTDGSEPSKVNGTLYTGPFQQLTSATIKAVAYIGSTRSDGVTSLAYTAHTLPPAITVSGNHVTITGSGNIYYTLDGSDPTTGSTLYSGTITLEDGAGTITIKAIAQEASKLASCPSSATAKVAKFISTIEDLNAVAASDDCMLTADIDASSFAASIAGFTGTFEAGVKDDGTYYTISGLTKPLFASTNGAVIKNVMLKGVSISTSGKVGALVGEAGGYTRIYNCGILPTDATNSVPSTVASTDDYCGGLVGWLKDNSRVINCFSFANITGGTTVAGIVGYNDYASTAAVTDGKYANLRTAVVNCMFYGNITGGTERYPVYGGNMMNNKGDNAINNYDFYRAEASLGLADDTHYNCSWPAKEEYLTRYEYYRNLLNSNRELCGWWVGAPSAPSTMTTAEVQAVPKDASLMAKWVLDPAIAPYPILKAFGKYASPVNQDPDKRLDGSSRALSSNWGQATAPDTEGQILGTVTVTISGGDHHTGSIDRSIKITAMDLANDDYCYGKIQLPYYNDVFGNPSSPDWATKYADNYGDYVVTGWEIVTTDGPDGTFTEDWQDGYNFADRSGSNKDKYSVSGRVFAQGGYYYVPDGVTSITIKAHWAQAIYFDNTDHSYDRVYMSKGGSSGVHFAPAGSRPTTLDNGQTVYSGTINEVADHITAAGSVYDYALVLVGNHQYRASNTDVAAVTHNTNGFTIMSADFDLDDEPDNSLIWQLGQKYTRQNICPIRFDFLPVVEIGLAMKENASTQYYSLGCYRPLGHFEVTETSLIHFGQFEFGNKDRQTYAPLILNGGIFDQYTKGTESGNRADDHITYIIIGGNVTMPSFTPGAHVKSSAKYPTRHCAVNVIGGKIDNLYLTGNYNESVTPYKDNPHCYIDGGSFQQVAAAGKEGINGNVYWKINHAVIKEFYGGGTLADKLVTGDIHVAIDNSRVTKFCGGPKFGDMSANKTVTTDASGTTFTYYYGGGNGGTSYVQYASTDVTTTATGYNWNGTGNNQGRLNDYSPGTFRNTGTGYQANYDMEIINVSTGTEAGQAVMRTYFYAAQFSATNTGSITNNLTNCVVLTNFYGGGNLGGVNGDVTSTLTGTHVYGSAFGAGYSASVPQVTIYNKDKVAPTINIYTGLITPQSGGSSTTYTWTNDPALSTGSPISGGYFYTEVPLTNLGSVSGNVTLNIEGTTLVDGNEYNINTTDLSYSLRQASVGGVFGGGDESKVSGTAKTVQVNINNGTVNNVFGGGNNGDVASRVEVNVEGGSVTNDVYGGGKGETTVVGGDVVVNIGTMTDDEPPAYVGAATVGGNVYGGSALGNTNAAKGDGWSVGDLRLSAVAGKTTQVNLYGGDVTGNVFGGGLGQRQVGDPGDPGYEPAIASNVYGAVTVTAEGGTAANVFGCNDQNGAPQSTVAVVINGTDDPVLPSKPNPIGNVYGGGNLASYTGDPSVTMTGGTVNNVFGGGLGTSAVVTGNPVVAVSGGTINTDVYGGGEEAGVTGNSSVTLSGGTVGNDLFGGGKDADVTGTVSVSITGGTVTHDVYGGGALANTNTATTIVEGKTVYPKTTITLTGGSIDNVYGGGLGRKNDPESKPDVAATSGNVLIELNKGVANDTKGCVVNQIFGCNNVNGSPLDSVTVHVYKTQNAAAAHIAIQPGDPDDATIPKKKGRFDVAAVYGGGNQAAYNPANAATGKTIVLIEGCDETSIDHVYGGGNAAPVPATEVTINSSYEIDYLFGGGNGAGVGNPGADVGIINQTAYAADPSTGIYGTGQAVVKLIGGTINYVYGGSNTLGNVRGGTSVERKESNSCPLVVGELYGAGQNAEQDGDVNIVLECMPESFVDAVYGGAKNATINGNVTLTVTSGKFGRVFGGNNEGGSINGSITVNVFEAGCEPLIIGELYGGGNNAPYSIYGCNDEDGDDIWTPNEEVGEPNVVQDAEHPAIGVYVWSCTSIGKVFGGGYGATADVVGNTRVWINTLKGTVDDVEQDNIGKIGQVFGGGNAASVKGDVTLEIGTASSSHDIGVNITRGTYTDAEHGTYLNPESDTYIDITEPGIYGGGFSADVDGDVTIHIGTVNQNQGVNIAGNVFGGGYGATTTVTGDIVVNIGADTGTLPAHNYIGYASITGDVYGGSAKGKVNATKSGSAPSFDYAASGGTTEVNLYGGTITGNLYGGGYGLDAADADVYGAVTVNMYGGTISQNVYGGNNLSGATQDAINVNIAGGTISQNVYGGGNAADALGDVMVTVTDGSIANDVYGGGKGQTTVVEGDVTVTIGAKDGEGHLSGSGTISGSVYGGSALGSVNAAAVNIYSGTVTGNVFGGGLGETTPASIVAQNLGNTTVTMEGGTVGTAVYGGANANGRLHGDVTVTITGGTINSAPGVGDPIADVVFGGGWGQPTQVDGDVEVNIGTNTAGTLAGTAIIYGNVYGGSAEGKVNGTTAESNTHTTQVNLNQGTVNGTIYGGGLGTNSIAADVYGTVTVTTKGGTAQDVFGCNNVNGAPQQTVAVVIDGGNFNNIYGGGKDAAYTGSTSVTISDGTVSQNVYGGGLGATAIITGNTAVTISGGTVNNDVYGGGSLADVTGSVNVSMTGGHVISDLYGGGALANTNTSNWTGIALVADAYEAVTGLTVGTSSVIGLYTRSVEEPYVYTLSNDLKAKSGTTYYRKTLANTVVSLTGGIIGHLFDDYTGGNAYGGGLGRLANGNDPEAEGYLPAVAAMVYGDVILTVDGTGFLQHFKSPGSEDLNVPFSGRVFGCNNLNGTPKSNVLVTVLSTQQMDDDGNPISGHSENKYDIHSVYGGGNLSAYEPADGKGTHVIIDGCGITSIEKVFGGGNSAAVPGTDVLILGSFKIGYAFNGGNGADQIWRNETWHENDGAPVNGDASIIAIGGRIGQVFGGSDTKGAVTGQVTVHLKGKDSWEGEGYTSTCPLQITNSYGAGRGADVNGDINFIISGCTADDEIENVFGGSFDANIRGSITLTITSGFFTQVYGGNDHGGCIGGDITVNIEETEGCNPIVIQHLYGGGREAAYPGSGASTYTGGDVKDPANFTPFSSGNITVNVKSATRIDNVYGGCFRAQVNGNTSVNINMVKGSWATDEGGGKELNLPVGYTGDPVPNIHSGNIYAEVSVPKDESVVGKYVRTGVNTYEAAAGLSDGVTQYYEYRASTSIIDNGIGTVGNVYGGCYDGKVSGNTTVNIGTATTVGILKRNAAGKIVDAGGTEIYDASGKLISGSIVAYENVNVLGATITGNVFGGGDQADVGGNSTVNICTADYSTPPAGFEDVSIKNGTVYGGGNMGDVEGNTFVTVSGGYIFNGVFGGGYAGSVGTYTSRDYSTTVFGHTSHIGCVGKPMVCKTGTGKCTVVVNGGQIGPVEVATQGMTRPFAEGGPVQQGWVWGGACGIVEDPKNHPDTHFKAYVDSTDVTIAGTAFILEGVIGGGEFGRVLSSTLVKIEGGQIGVGAGQTETVGGVLKPKRYDDADFIDPTSATALEIEAKAAIMPECSHWDYESPYEPYDPYYYKYPTTHFSPGSTSHPTDGKSWIGVVFGGGSGYSPYEKDDGTGYDWCRSAGWVEGNTEVRITGGHILTNVYGANEYTDVGGKSTVKMSGGTIGLPRTLAQIEAHPLSCYLFGAGRGDERPHFNSYNNTGSVEVEVSGGIIYGSVFGGAEDGHVTGNVSVNIKPGAKIGTWGTSYVEGNVFGGGRGYSGENILAGNVGGNITVTITGGTMLGSVYGGGRLASVGLDASTGAMQSGDDHGHITLDISDGPSHTGKTVIGNKYEYKYLTSSVNTSGMTDEQIAAARKAELKNTYHVTAPDVTYQLASRTGDNDHYMINHVRGGCVYGGGMGRRELLDGTKNMILDWTKLGNVKSTTVNIHGENVWIKGSFFAGGEYGAVTGSHTSAEGRSVGTEAIINGDVTIGSVIGTSNDTYNGTVDSDNRKQIGQSTDDSRYTYGGAYGGGFGTDIDATLSTPISEINSFGALVSSNTSIKLLSGAVRSSVYGGGKVACVAGDTYVMVAGGTVGVGQTRYNPHPTMGPDYVLFGGKRMGNVCGGGRGSESSVVAGVIKGNTNITITGGSIYHNVYGGGALGSVGDFDLTTNENKASYGVMYANVPVNWKANTGLATVTITGGTIGINGHDSGMVNGSSRGDISTNEPISSAVSDPYDHLAWVNKSIVTIGTEGSGTDFSTPLIKGSVYGGGENGHNYGDAEVYVHSGTIGVVDTPEDTWSNRGSIYGAGCGTDTYSKHYDEESKTYVNFTDGLNHYDPMGGRVQGNTRVSIDGGHIIHGVYGAGSMGSVSGSSTVTISGGRIGTDGDGNGSVFGGPKGNEKANRQAHVSSTQTNINYTTTPATDNGSTTHLITGSVYGGGEFGLVYGNVVVNMDGGMVMNNLYGGGALASSNTANWDASANEGVGGWAAGKTSASSTTTVNLKGGTIVGDVYGGALGRFARAEVGTPGDPGYLSAETLVEPNVYGNILVELNRGVNTSTRGCAVTRIFGCNNLRGTPKGHVKVEVFGTQNTSKPDIIHKFTKYEAFSHSNYSDIVTSFGTISSELGITTPSADLAVVNDGEATEEEKKAAIANIKAAFRAKKYDVQYVYGGGNLATYAPVSDNEGTEVIINGCDETCIFTVYGGGNAAATPANSVVVNSVYEIEELFGGGNGKDDYQLSDGKWYENPGADVGYRDMTYYDKDGTHGTGADDDPYDAIVKTSPNATTKAGREANYKYGTGTASLTVYGGRIHTSYGGSNQKGNISTTATSKYEESGECPLMVDYTYGASNFAEMDADVVMIMDCVKNIDNIYGGSTNADVFNNIELNITNGHFKNVFGGNNTDGAIYGSITVNIKELGCQPINIENLYAGGYLAPYSIYGYQKEADGSYSRDGNDKLIPLTSGADPQKDPRINIISATRIDSIYGGGYQAKVVGSPRINVNMERGMVVAKYVDANYSVGNHTDEHGHQYTVEEIIDDAESPYNNNAVLAIGTIGYIYGGGNQADIIGNTYVEIGTGEWVNDNGDREMTGTDGKTYVYNTTSEKWEYQDGESMVPVLTRPAPARNAATIMESVYGGGNQGDVSGNTSITMANGSVADRMFGGGQLGNVGTITSRTTPIGHSHGGVCIQKPSAFADGTGTCTIVFSGGKIGKDNMSMTKVGGPDDYGYIFGGGRGEVVDPRNNPDIDFTTYVNETYVTVSDSAFVLGGVYGGAENGRVLHDTHVNIEGGQVGCGAGRTTPYADEDFIDPTVSTAAAIDAKAATMTECAAWTYGAKEGYDRFTTYDPHALASGYYDTGGTNSAGGGRPFGDDGHTFYGNVFGGGSGFYPYLKKKADPSDPDDYDWLPSAGLVEGDTHLTISGGHILTNIYGGNEMTDVTGTCYVTMTGGTLGVPRTLSQILAHPLTCYLFGGGKGDPRSHFNTNTNVGNVVVDVSGGIIYGSVFGGGEDGHVLGDVTMTIADGAKIGTWGTSYVDGNVFGAGRGFSGVSYTAGNVGGSVTMDITGGKMLGSIYGGGRLGSVGYGLYSSESPNSGVMRADTKDDRDNDAAAKFPNGRGHTNITISGGTIGNPYEFIYPQAGNIPGGLNADFKNWDADDWATWKTANHVPNTVFDASNGRVTHTKGGNVFAGGMGRRELLDGTTEITAIDWKRLGAVKSTSLTISGDPWIMSCVYGGGELGAVRTAIADNTDPLNPVLEGGTTTIDIQGGTIGSEITNTTVQKATVPVPTDGISRSAVKYTFGSVYGGGMGTQNHGLTEDHGGDVNSNTTVSISGAGTKVRASVFGGGEMAIVDGNTTVNISDGEIGRNEVKPVNDEDAGYVLFGSSTMGNVYGGGKGAKEHVFAGLVKGNTTINVSGGNIYHMIYGGGALGSVGTFRLAHKNWDGTDYADPASDLDLSDIPKGIPLEWREGTGNTTLNITGGTIGISGRDNGLVFGSSRGDLTRPTGSPLRDPYDYVAWINNSVVNVGTEGSSDLTTPHIICSLYGGGENGHNKGNATVNVYSGTIGITDSTYTWYHYKDKALEKRAMSYRGNVYGAGSGADTYSVTVGEGPSAKKYTYYNPKAGLVSGNTYVNIRGGHVGHNVYGGGATSSVGVITNAADTISTAKHVDKATSFALSWPYNIEFAPDGGKTYVTITGGRIGIGETGIVGDDNGNVYGGSRGVAGSHFFEAHLANVNETYVTINYAGETPTSDAGYITPLIAGSVFGGAEDGHVMGDTHVSMQNGLIKHSLFAAGRGQGTFKRTLKKLSDGSDTSERDVRSITSGKVYGNTYLEMSGGRVWHNVFGGGYMASVGKGNYSGGSDDYATTGYGETITGKLWQSDAVGDNAWHFLNSGKTYLTITGGTIGLVGPDLWDGIPAGCVFGGSRGVSAPNIDDMEKVSPEYCPDFFSGYVNETYVTIGGDYKCVQACVDNNTKTHIVGEALTLAELQTLFKDNATVMNGSTPRAAYWVPIAGDGPRIYGSVYGGGQDGHVRREAHMIINKGEIGLPYTDANRTALGTSGLSLEAELNSPHWLLRGNVFGAGSGLGQYSFDMDGDPDTPDETGYSTSAGSVTHFTQVDINGGTIHRNVYGGGSLASVGPPPVMEGTAPYDIRRRDDTSVTMGRRSVCLLNIAGTVGSPIDYNAIYGGEVYGASRGEITLDENRYSTAIWTQVNLKNGADIKGNVFGGGDAGMVKQDAEVNVGVEE